MHNVDNRIVLLLGGARSGKSARAQQMAEEFGGSVLFCATAQALDEEMQARIEAHKKSRPTGWDTLESSRNIGKELRNRAHGYDTVIVDCITLLVSNCLCDETATGEAAQSVAGEIASLVDLMQRRPSNFILVSNEAGSGLVPDNKLGRLYRDLLGQANQQLAKCADEVHLMAAGLSIKMK
jgi:adenosylcobinamide kinase / adenosylcobinamide-phosphate guanylyltransferase